MICTITNSSISAKKKLDVNFYGSKQDLIQCIFMLIKLYFKDFKESEE